MYSYELTKTQDNDSVNKFKLSGSNYVQHLFTLMVLICPVLEPSVVIFRACFPSPGFYIVFLVVHCTNTFLLLRFCQTSALILGLFSE